MNQTNEIILIKISGEDKPGVTSSLTSIIAKYDATILDIGQADIHNSLSLGILFKSTQKDSGFILKELLFKASELGVSVRFNPISDEDYNKWVSMQGKNRYIVTLLGRNISAKLISSVSQVLALQGLNIDTITRLTGRVPLEEDALTKASVEMSVRGTPKDKQFLQSEFLRLSQELGYDISFQEDNLFRRNRRLICFDMDSTLIETEVIDELAERAGVGEQVRAITESAMRGEIDFCESFKQRVALLKGLDESVMEDIANNLPIMEGADRVLNILKKYGYKIAILSGGFTYFGNSLKKRFGVDYVYANELEIVDGKLTGRYLGDIVDGKRKAELLRLIAQIENLDLQQVIAVGDGANDLPMLNCAGLGIAFHAKPKVKENAKQSISSIGLDGVLYLLGFKDSYIEV
ncbi:MAG TPA: phosphoserine phosphatase SerB [Paludibacteraceae bacterium]|nr:phosphoserine phosphatase SerB [Paludibacteraceae bacterium]HOU69675.1 phosphoserine phosphatase SerB [Paludibacteraceae bacterium]HPH63594.1 phosphoserine phosphatase SerB [Paludibacteraceae bacterium]HQF51286.1 phosphoserine phosphatase SerB [Paludibacteraceae bacterium]